MSKFLNRGSSIDVFDDADMKMLDHLEPGVYALSVAMGRGFYLQRSPALTVPSRIYGDAIKTSERILTTFSQRSGSTGVLLHGEKGAGKSLLSRIVCMKAVEQGLPVIMVSSDFGGDGFNTFLQKLTQPTVFFFDEFEKVYGEDGGKSQQALLSLLDGVGQGRRLYLFTSNDLYKINEFMRERPGRVFYSYEFKTLPPSVVTEYLEDNLKNKGLIADTVSKVGAYNVFSFDRLQAVVEEMNRYDETFDQVATVLNIGKPMPQFASVWKARCIQKSTGKIVCEKEFYFDFEIMKKGDRSYSFLVERDPPFSEEEQKKLLEEKYKGEETHEFDMECNYLVSIPLTTETLKKINTQQKKLLFETDDFRLILEEKIAVYKRFDYGSRIDNNDF
jgi:hypothetical protein